MFSTDSHRYTCFRVTISEIQNAPETRALDVIKRTPFVYTVNTPLPFMNVLQQFFIRTDASHTKTCNAKFIFIVKFVHSLYLCKIDLPERFQKFMLPGRSVNRKLFAGIRCGISVQTILCEFLPWCFWYRLQSFQNPEQDLTDTDDVQINERKRKYVHMAGDFLNLE